MNMTTKKILSWPVYGTACWLGLVSLIFIIPAGLLILAAIAWSTWGDALTSEEWPETFISDYESLDDYYTTNEEDTKDEYIPDEDYYETPADDIEWLSEFSDLYEEGNTDQLRTWDDGTY